jgi:hypothetical protein
MVVSVEPQLAAIRNFSVFEWTHPPLADVTWNGSEYVVALRYAYSWDSSYLATVRVSADGSVGQRLVARVGHDFSRPTIASNTAGESAIVISEPVVRGESSRARLYFERDMIPARPKPPAPIADAVAIDDRRILVRLLKPSGLEDGWFVTGEQSAVGSTERVNDTVALYVFRTSYVKTLRVQSWNESGLSPVVTIPVHTRRLRTVSSR